MTPPLWQKKKHRELKSRLMKEKEDSEKADLKLNIQNTKIRTSGLISSWQIDGETMEAVTDFIFLGSKFIADGDWAICRGISLSCWKTMFAMTSIFS